jgi:hypothetical protein
MRNIAKVLWTPFDQQFGGLKEKLKLHRRILEIAIEDHTVKTAEKTYTRLEALVEEVRSLAARQKESSRETEDAIFGMARVCSFDGTC